MKTSWLSSIFVNFTHIITSTTHCSTAIQSLSLQFYIRDFSSVDPVYNTCKVKSLSF